MGMGTRKHDLIRTLLSPSPMSARRAVGPAVLVLLALSLASLLAAPLLMPESYSWTAHTVSESAAQGVQGAWLGRLGFLLFGLAAIWVAAASRPVWPRVAVWLFTAFGALLVATAAFSARPWIAGEPFDPVEDALHSFTATAMGFAFAFGVSMRFLSRAGRDRTGRILDVVAVVAAVAIPLVMLSQPAMAGAAQRLMFGIAYAWFAREAWLLPRRYTQADAPEAATGGRTL
jgi:hypothetical protein